MATRVGLSATRLRHVLVVAAVAATCLWPVLALVVRGLSLPAPGATTLWQRAGAADVVGTALATLAQASLSTVACLALGVPAGLALGRYGFPGRRLVSAAMVAPFVLPSVVVGAAFVAVFPTWPPLLVIVVAHAAFNAGLVARIVAAAVGSVDHRLIDAARSLGAPRRGVVAVVVGAIAPRILGAAAIVFALCATSFGVVIVVGGGRFRTLETEIWYQTTRALDLRLATVIALVQSVVVLPFAISRMGRIDGGVGDVVAARRRPRVPALLAIGALSAVVAVPLVRLAISSVGHYGGLSTIGDGTSAATELSAILARSVGYASLAAALVLVVALAAAGSGRSRPRWLDVVVTAPLSVSGATLGLGLLVGYGRPPLDLRASIWPVIGAEFAIALPLVYRLIGDAVDAVPAERRRAAADLGAPPFAAWRTVVVPQIVPALLAGGALAFAIGLGEVAAVSFLARNDAPTVPLVIARLLGRAGSVPRGQAMALSCILAALCVAAWVVADLVGPRRSRRGHR